MAQEWLYAIFEFLGLLFSNSRYNSLGKILILLNECFLFG